MTTEKASELETLDDADVDDTLIENEGSMLPAEQAPSKKGGGAHTASKKAVAASKKAPKAVTKSHVALTPAQMEERIAALEAENAFLSRRAQSAPPELPENPDDEVTVTIPLTETGYPISINGKKYFGKMTVTRRVLDTILSMLGNHAMIQRELTQKRGTQVSMSQLAADDTVSRIQQRRLGRHVISGDA